MAKGSVSTEKMGNLFPFLFLFPSIPLYFGWGRLAYQEREERFRSIPKKHLTKRKVYVPRHSISRRVLGPNLYVHMSESMCRHNSSIWTNQSLSNISKKQPKSERRKRVYRPALDSFFDSLSISI